MIIKIIKIYLGLSWFFCGCCGFSSFLASSLVRFIFLKIYRPLPMQSVVTTGFWSIACSFQGVSLCYIFFSLFSRAVGREGGMLQTNNTGVRSQCLSHTGSAPAHCACSLPAHTARALGCSAGNNPRLALGCMYLPGPSRSGSGTRVVLRGADSVGPAFCALPRSEQLR